MLSRKKLVYLLLIIVSRISEAAPLGQLVIIDPRHETRSITYEQINEFAVVEGDILLTKMQNILKKRALVRLITLGGSRWEHRLVPFEVAEDLPLLKKIAALEAVAYWQKKTNVEFIELTSKNRHNYPDYIVFTPAAGTTCSSYVGRQGGRQEILLANRCATMNIVHEIGHALGLWHEHSRSDRANFIRIIWENINDDHKFNFEQHLSDGEDFGDYDYQSIMHYNAYAFSKNGEKTILPLTDGVEIGQRVGLSEKDIAAINAIYPKM